MKKAPEIQVDYHITCAGNCGARGIAHHYLMSRIIKDLGGWIYLVANDSTTYYLCPECGSKAIQAAKVLYDLVGDPEILIDGLLAQGGVDF
jgi:hypothetical protein